MCCLRVAAGETLLQALLIWKERGVTLPTSVDVNVLPQSLVLLQVLQEVLVLSEDGEETQISSSTLNRELLK